MSAKQYIRASGARIFLANYGIRQNPDSTDGIHRGVIAKKLPQWCPKLRVLLPAQFVSRLMKSSSFRWLALVPVLVLVAVCPGLGQYPLSAQEHLVTVVPDGCWTWFNDPRAIFHNGALYVGAVQAAGGGRSVLQAFDLKTGQATRLWTSSLAENDDHDVPGLLVLPDGRLFANYARHGRDQFFCHRTSLNSNPVSPADWGEEKRIAPTGAGFTYANPFRLTSEPGKLYEFSRNLNFNPTLFISTNGGAGWSGPQWMIQTGKGSTRPYLKYSSDYQSRIDFLYTDAHPDNFTCSLYHMYYQAGSFRKTDGSFLSSLADLPLQHDAGQRGSTIYQYHAEPGASPDEWIAGARAWCWDVATQSNGAPYCVFQTKVDAVTGTNWFDARIYYYYARWTGSAWQKRFIAQAGRPFYKGQPDYGGGIALDPVDPDTVYLSSIAANPFDLGTTTEVPLAPHYEIYKGVTRDGGLTFKWSAVTTHSPVDNGRPYVPRRMGGEPCVLWWRGTYTTYTAFNTSIMGLFTSEVPGSNLIK